MMILYHLAAFSIALVAFIAAVMGFHVTGVYFESLLNNDARIKYRNRLSKWFDSIYKKNELAGEESRFVKNWISPKTSLKGIDIYIYSIFWTMLFIVIGLLPSTIPTIFHFNGQVEALKPVTTEGAPASIDKATLELNQDRFRVMLLTSVLWFIYCLWMIFRFIKAFATKKNHTYAYPLILELFIVLFVKLSLEFAVTYYFMKGHWEIYLVSFIIQLSLYYFVLKFKLLKVKSLSHLAIGIAIFTVLYLVLFNTFNPSNVPIFKFSFGAPSSTFMFFRTIAINFIFDIITLKIFFILFSYLQSLTFVKKLIVFISVIFLSFFLAFLEYAVTIYINKQILGNNDITVLTQQTKQQTYLEYLVNSVTGKYVATDYYDMALALSSFIPLVLFLFLSIGKYYLKAVNKILAWAAKKFVSIEKNRDFSFVFVTTVLFGLFLSIIVFIATYTMVLKSI